MTQGRSRSGSRWLLMSQMIFGPGVIGTPRYRNGSRRPKSDAQLTLGRNIGAGLCLGWRRLMKAKLTIAIVSMLVVGLVVAGAASGAFVAIYRNALETTAQRSEVLKVSGKACSRGGGQSTLNITVGKLTEECAYKTPVVGQDLEIAATGSINPVTP